MNKTINNETLKNDYKYNIVNILHMNYKTKITYLINKQRHINEFIEYLENNSLNVSYGRDDVNLKNMMLNTINDTLYIENMDISFDKLINNLLIKLELQIQTICEEMQTVLKSIEKTNDTKELKTYNKVLELKEFKRKYYTGVFNYILNDLNIKYDKNPCIE